MMNLTTRRILQICLAVICLITFAPSARCQWTAPTPEELKMTSQPEAPGAPAVYLFKEEITDDSLHDWSVYVRLKVLTERGKEYANVELRQYEVTNWESAGGYTVKDIQGRTIHPDGTIIPFTGKPFEKLVEKGQGVKEMAKVFTLPDVEVGSIIEYRYHLRYDDNNFIAPEWLIQSDLFTRKAHYLWRPTGDQLITKGEHGEQVTSAIAWAPILPVGTAIKQTRMPPTSTTPGGQLILELNMQNVPAVPDEEYMPPIKSLSYRVMFYYSPYTSIDDYWKNEGKGWSKTTDKFIGPNDKVAAAVRDLTADATTQDQKLRKIYAAVMQLDNTAFDRDHSATEDKAQGLNPPKSTDDIWERKRGTDDQLAELFVAMARAAGMKAYIMFVTDRDHSLFNRSYASFSQLDDEIAIVNVGGKEQYFDPGQRYCPYGHLAWKHTLAAGIRQIDGGTELSGAPGESYKDSTIKRVADLKVDDQGAAAGTVTLSWTGAAALKWRQAHLLGDDTSLHHDLREALEHLLPGGTDIELDSIEHLEDYEQPLTVNFDVKGQIAASTGKRLIIPGDLFEMNATPAFPHEKRDIAVYFEYPYTAMDAVRITYPPTLSLESQPATANLPFGQTAVYTMSSKTTPNSVTMYRNLLSGEIAYPPAQYPDLRAFYTRFETKDQEPIVLKAAVQSAGN
jgi:hypothetical protein